MGSTVGLKLWVMGLVLVAAAALPPVSCVATTVECGDVVSALVPCGPFLLGVQGENNPSAQCCQSAQTLNKMSTTVELRRQLCKCLTQTGPSFGVQPERAKRLPPYCKLRLDMPISPTMDCNKVQ